MKAFDPNYKLLDEMYHLTKTAIGSRTERLNGHIGTETRPRLLREAAVGDIAQWGQPTQENIL